MPRHEDEEAPDAKQVSNRDLWPFGYEGDPDTVPTPLGVACNVISSALSRAKEAAGEFSFGGVATILPESPGLFVNGLGLIQLPLTEDAASKLIAVCQKSPIGRGLDTLMSESVRKSWQLAVDRFRLLNPIWHSGMQILVASVAEKLGYEDVSMQFQLYELVVYGPGGHFAKHQDTEKEDRMVATLEIQLPSVHEGGDLVVYQGNGGQHRHNFGKNAGTAAYYSHYAVHYADAEHAVEAVASAYRLVLVYSLCLPPTMSDSSLGGEIRPVDDVVVDAINRMKSSEGFALLLAHEYTEKSIKNLGTGALKGIDRARLQVLARSNGSAAPNKKLYLFLADLSLLVGYVEDCRSWEESGRHQSISWYSVAGEKYGLSTMMPVLNFLNPGAETLADLWRIRGGDTGYLGNEGATSVTTYSRYAIVAWPVMQATKKALKFINEDAAVKILQSVAPISSSALLVFMNEVLGRFALKQAATFSISFCRGMCDLLVTTGDLILVILFFNKFFFLLNDKEALVPSIIAIVRTFAWKDIGQALLNTGAGIDFLLGVLDGLDHGVAQIPLLYAVVNMAIKLRDDLLCSSKTLSLLWKWTIHCGVRYIFDVVADKFQRMDPSQLRPVVEGFSQHLVGVEDDKLAVLTSIAWTRIRWLKRQLLCLDRPMSWEMPDAVFTDNAHVQAFLRGPETSMSTMGIIPFLGINQARSYACKCTRQKQINASFELKPFGRGRGAHVVITKTPTWLADRQKALQLYQPELQRLLSFYSDAAGENAPKRARVA